MKKKSFISIFGATVLALTLGLALVGCGGGGGGYKIAVPSDTTNEARALLLLEDQGLIKLREGAGLAATANDIVENPYNIEIIETEAAAIARTVQDVDFAVINGNYALSAGLDPATALAGEDAASEAAIEYGNVIAVRSEDAESAKTAALVEVLQGEEVRQFIEDTYEGAVVSVDVPVVGNAKGANAGSDDNTITVGASPVPHAEILDFAAPLLEEKGYTLKVVEFSDYVLPNVALFEGELDANYFQHLPYLEDYNAENGVDLVSAAKIHFEPLSLYPGKTASIADIKG